MSGETDDLDFFKQICPKRAIPVENKKSETHN